MVEGLNELYNNKIIHRDLKPENIILDKNGYAYISDFGIAQREGYTLTNKDIGGTLGYMAPEILYQGESLRYTADYFSLGMLLHEILFGFVPIQGDDISAVKKFFVSNKLKVNKEQSKTISKDCVDFMNRLFHKKNKKRLGYTGGINDLKHHSWFDNFNWAQLENKELKAPFIPSSTKDNFNTNLNKERYIQQVIKAKQDSTLKNTVAIQYYKNYTFIGDTDDNKEKESKYNSKYSDPNTSNNINEESESENQQKSVNSSECLKEESESNESYSQSKSRNNDDVRETEGNYKQQNSSSLSDSNSSQSKQSKYIKQKKRKHKNNNNTKKKFVSSLNSQTKSLILSSSSGSSKALTRNIYQINEYFPEVNKHKKFTTRKDSKTSYQTMLNIYEQNKNNIFRQNPNHFELDSPTNYNQYNHDLHKTNTSLPKILSPQGHSYLVSIKEETPINIRYQKNSLSNSKFFNYNVENHIKDQESKTLSPFKYVANQIQSARQFHKLNKHKTIRNNGHIFSSFDTTKNDSETNNNKLNQDNSFAEPYSIIHRHKSNQSLTTLRPNRRKSFFDFTLGMN